MIQKEFSAQFPIADLTMEQLAELQQRALITGYRPDPGLDRSAEAIKALEPHFKGAGVDAVRAHLLAAQIVARAGEEQKAKARDHIGAALKHASFAEAARQKAITSVWFMYAYDLDREAQVALVPDLQVAVAKFPGDAPVGSIVGATTVYEAAMASENSAYKAAAEGARQGGRSPPGGRGGCLARERPPHGEGELDSLFAAPKIACWSVRPRPSWRSSGRRGASPLVARGPQGQGRDPGLLGHLVRAVRRHLPQIRDLVAHYKGYPVEVVGVTSVQGATHFQGGTEKAETPDEEYEQMVRYIEERDITWTVAFTTQNVFNPDYGVRNPARGDPRPGRQDPPPRAAPRLAPP